jgi:hypothetical protein
MQAQEVHQVSLSISQAEELSADAGMDIIAEVGEVIQLGSTPSASGGTAPYEYSWSPEHLFVNPSVSNPEITMPDTEATIVFTVLDANQCLSMDTIILVPESVLGIDELQIKVYPNPSRSGFTVEAQVDNGTLSLINQQGQVVFRDHSFSRIGYVNSKSLKAGVYLMILTNEQGVQIKSRLVKF